MNIYFNYLWFLLKKMLLIKKIQNKKNNMEFQLKKYIFFCKI